jgi:hypothetical protein
MITGLETAFVPALRGQTPPRGFGHFEFLSATNVAPVMMLQSRLL